jgi:hypothetical protein
VPRQLEPNYDEKFDNTDLASDREIYSRHMASILWQSWRARLTTRCELTRTRPGTSFGYQENIVPHPCRQYPGHAKPSSFNSPTAWRTSTNHHRTSFVSACATERGFRSPHHLGLSLGAQGRNRLRLLRLTALLHRATGYQRPYPRSPGVRVGGRIPLYRAGIFAFGQGASSDVRHAQCGYNCSRSTDLIHVSLDFRRTSQASPYSSTDA